MYMLHLIVLVTCVTSKLTQAEGLCGDGWDVFHDEYYDICYKYIAEGLGDYQTVRTACMGELDSSLPTINSKAEQDFLNTMIVKYKMVESVWLDAGIKNKHIVWADKTSTEYENWIDGRPGNDSNCVEMVADQLNLGKWLDQPCTKKNSYVCKRVVIWSGQRTERLISDLHRLLEKNIDEIHLSQFKITQLETNLGESQTKITELEKSKVPIGFIYVQLPSQVDPNVLWPAYTWSDVTATYAGQFFRAEGNGSLEFGASVQPENAPRLSEVKNYPLGAKEWDLKITPGVMSERIFTGAENGGAGPVSISFLVSGGEVRPRNQAVRIFKRTK